MLIDTHSHIYDEVFDGDRDAVLEVFVDCAAKGTDYSFCVHWMHIGKMVSAQ